MGRARRRTGQAVGLSCTTSDFSADCAWQSKSEIKSTMRNVLKIEIALGLHSLQVLPHCTRRQHGTCGAYDEVSHDGRVPQDVRRYTFTRHETALPGVAKQYHLRDWPWGAWRSTGTGHARCMPHYVVSKVCYDHASFATKTACLSGRQGQSCTVPEHAQARQSIAEGNSFLCMTSDRYVKYRCRLHAHT